MKIGIDPKDKMLKQNSDGSDTVDCPICGHDVTSYWDPRYNGLRGSCKICGFNWAES